MKYYVKVILENGLINQDIDVFSTMEEAKMFKNLAEKAGNKAEIYEIELIPAELEKLHEYKIVSKLSVEKLQKELESCIQTLIEASVAATITQNIVVGNLVDRKLANLAKTHKLAVDYIEKVTGKNIDVVLAENAALEAEEE